MSTLTIVILSIIWFLIGLLVHIKEMKEIYPEGWPNFPLGFILFVEIPLIIVSPLGALFEFGMFKMFEGDEK